MSEDEDGGIFCVYCDQPGATEQFSCQKCWLVWYCSKACSDADKQVHRVLCDPFLNFNITPPNSPILNAKTRPSESHIRALRLDKDSNGPQFFWMQVNASGNQPTRDVLREQVGLSSFMDARISDLHWKISAVSQATFPPPSQHKLRLVGLKQNGNCDPSLLNKAHSVLGLAKPGHLTTLFGSCFVYAYTQVFARDGIKIVDFTFRDYRNVIDAIHQDKKNPCVPHFSLSRVGLETIKARKINCVGDVDHHQNPRFEVVNASAVCLTQAHDQWASAFAFVLGLPWYCRVVSTNSDFLEDHSSTPDHRADAFTLPTPQQFPDLIVQTDRAHLNGNPDFSEQPEASRSSGLPPSHSYYHNMVNEGGEYLAAQFVDFKGSPLMKLARTTIGVWTPYAGIRCQNHVGTILVLDVSGFIISIEEIKVFVEFCNKSLHDSDVPFTKDEFQIFKEEDEDAKKAKRLSLILSGRTPPRPLGVHRHSSLIDPICPADDDGPLERQVSMHKLYDLAQRETDLGGILSRSNVRVIEELPGDGEGA